MKTNESHKHRRKVFILIFNFLLGFFLWFDFFTNIRLAGKFSELIFPPLIGVVGVASFLFLAKDYSIGRKMLFRFLACLPSILGGILSVTLFFPPMLVYTLALINSDELEVQSYQIVSPDKSKVAEVYQSYVGLVDGDSKASIRISSPWLPWIEKEVFVETGGSTDWCDGDAGNCLQWRNNQTLSIRGGQAEITVDGIKLDSPDWLLAIIISYLLVT
jgi:hypothetical protein